MKETMKIDEFHEMLTGSEEESPLLAALRKVMHLESPSDIESSMGLDNSWWAWDWG